MHSAYSITQRDRKDSLFGERMMLILLKPLSPCLVNAAVVFDTVYVRCLQLLGVVVLIPKLRLPETRNTNIWHCASHMPLGRSTNHRYCCLSVARSDIVRITQPHFLQPLDDPFPILINTALQDAQPLDIKKLVDLYTHW